MVTISQHAAYARPPAVEDLRLRTERFSQTQVMRNEINEQKRSNSRAGCYIFERRTFMAGVRVALITTTVGR